MKLKALIFESPSPRDPPVPFELDLTQSENFRSALLHGGPLAYLVATPDLQMIRRSGVPVVDRGRKHRSKQLARYLVGVARDGVPIIDGGYESARQVGRSVRALLSAATGEDKVYVIGAEPAIVAKLETAAVDQLARKPPATAPEGDSDACFVGQSADARGIHAEIQRVAKHDFPMLILGESGTGKGEIARLIHESSGRKGRFVTVECGAIPHDLLESELYGYAKGAFSGSGAGNIGRWKSADGGTLFLDEIGDLALEHQKKLLRAIEAKEVWPLGKSKPVKVSARVVAATHRDLCEMVNEGQFRADLYYRLRPQQAVFVPPLRDHRNDIPLLAQHLWRRIAKKHGGNGHVRPLPTDILQELKTYPFRWPGNVRELDSVLEHLFTKCKGGRCTVGQLGESLARARKVSPRGGDQPSDMDLLSSDLVRPLKIADKHFLEVLLTEFRLKRKGDGSDLALGFDDETPAIWSTYGKQAVQAMMADFGFERKAGPYQSALDAFLLRNKGESYEFSDRTFPFRYASGGVLPVLRMGREEFYCFFYRAVFPVGWNIANGGCNGVRELLDPLEAVERKLQEELLIVDIERRKRYVFRGENNHLWDRPEHVLARRLWREQFADADLEAFETHVVPMKWIEGPDSVTVRAGEEQPRAIKGVFLNVNADDFGIEIDRIAKIYLDDEVVLCDGGVRDGRLLDRPIGLFRVSRFNRAVRDGESEFFPDLLFHNGRLYDAASARGVIEGRYIDHLTTMVPAEEMSSYFRAKKRYGRCPVTRGITERYVRSQNQAGEGPCGPFDVFISHGEGDADLAARVARVVKDAGKTAFLLTGHLSDLGSGKAIDDALDSAPCLVAVAGHPQRIREPRPAYEWGTFHQEILNGRKPNGRIVSVVAGFDPAYLPRPLRTRPAIVCDPADPSSALPDILKHIT